MMRQKLELGNCLTVGHVGRFNEMKNHLFLLEVFAQIKKSRPDAQLILLGEAFFSRDFYASTSSSSL